MIEIQAGMIVKSKMGRDKGQYYLILSLDSECVYLTDGKYRPIEKLKKKKRKHIQTTRTKVEFPIHSKDLNNEWIKNTLKNYLKKEVPSKSM